jgi:hypothetical protein
MDKNEINQHWFDMPEFFQESQKEFQKITIRFQTESDVKSFADLINQKITPKTKSIWFPKLDRFKNKGVFYGD